MLAHVAVPRTPCSLVCVYSMCACFCFSMHQPAVKARRAPGNDIRVDTTLHFGIVASAKRQRSTFETWCSLPPVTLDVFCPCGRWQTRKHEEVLLMKQCNQDRGAAVEAFHNTTPRYAIPTEGRGRGGDGMNSLCEHVNMGRSRSRPS